MNKETPQQRWDKKNGYIAKTYKMRKSLADEFKATCDRLGVSQSGQIVKMMSEFIEKNKSDNLSHTIKNDDMISKKEVLNRLERTRPSEGQDNSKERYRHLQWIADRNTIREM